MRAAWAVIAALAGPAWGCAVDRVLQPEGSADAAPVADARTLPDADRNAPDGGAAVSAHCNMTGRWIVAQTTYSRALSATQTAINWAHYVIAQGEGGDGERFTITENLDCGFTVSGSATVTLPDATLRALAERSARSSGRQGTFRDRGDGTCEFRLDRVYNIRGADADAYLYDHWDVGDPPVALGDLPALPENGGLEDWDGDGKHGITLDAGGLGKRYVGQRDWNEHQGIVPHDADRFGGPDVIVVDWDGEESVSEQTSVLLRTTSTPENPGFARYARVGDDVQIIPGDALTSCKNVQRRAIELLR